MSSKIYLDCTHTYNSGLNTGIQRVVKNIVKNRYEVQKELNVEVIPVILTNNKYYKFNDFPQINQKKNRLKKVLKKIYTKARSLLSFILPKQLNDILHSPSIGINLNKAFDKILFSKKVSSDNNVILKTNDILLLIDTTWLNNNYKVLDKLKKKNVKIVTLIYDIIPISYSQFCTIDSTNALKDWYRSAVKYIDGYIAISNSVKDDVYNYIKENIDSNISYDRFDYFYLGADFSNAKDTQYPSESFKQHFKNNNTYLTVSTIEPRKNHKYILDAFDILWDNDEDVNYVMIGKIGWKTDKFIKRIKTHKLYNKRLFLLDDVNDADLSYAYQNSKALIFASFIEGFGLPIIESLNYKLPVLASNTPIHREIGKDKVLYFDLDSCDSLVDIIKNNKFKNVENISWLSWEQSAKDLILKCL